MTNRTHSPHGKPCAMRGAALLLFLCLSLLLSAASAGCGLQAQRVWLNTDEKLKVYSGPGTEYIRAADGKASVSTNDWIDLYGTDRGWALVSYQIDQSRYRFGYVRADAFSGRAETADLPFENVKTMLLEDAVLTDDPIAFSSTLSVLTAGQPATLLAHWEDWAYIEYKNMRGFVKESALVAGTAAGSAVTNRNNVNVRKAADKNSALVMTLKKAGTQVLLTGSENGADGYLWYAVLSENGKEGYIREDFLRLQPLGTAVTTKNSVNVRRSADKGSKKVATISKKGTEVSVRSSTQGKDGYTWYEITDNGKTGFVREDFLRLQGVTSTAAPEPTAVAASVPESPAPSAPETPLSAMEEFWNPIDFEFLSAASPWMDENGYTQPEEIGAAAKALYDSMKHLEEDGTVEAVTLCEEGGTVTVFPHGDGFPTVYGFISEGTNGGAGEEYAVASLNGMILSNRLKNWFRDKFISYNEISNTGADRSAEYILGNVPEYTEHVHLSGNDMTVAGLRSFLQNAAVQSGKKTRILFWNSHGGVHTTEDGLKELIFALPESWDDNRADHDYGQDRDCIVRNTVGCVLPLNIENYKEHKTSNNPFLDESMNLMKTKPVFCVTSEFFRKYLAEVDGGLFVSEACHSAEDDGLFWEILESKGFDGYIGTTGQIQSDYGDAFVRYFTEILAHQLPDGSYMTASDAFDAAVEWKPCDKNGVSFHIFPENEPCLFRLIPVIETRFMVDNRLGDVIDAEITLSDGDRWNRTLHFPVDSEGRWLDVIGVPASRAGMFNLTITAKNYRLVQQQIPVLMNQTLDFRLVLNGTCEGTVTDEQTGAPLPGVMVSCTREPMATDNFASFSTTAVTDSSGHFSLTDLDIGEYSLSFSLDGYEDAGGNTSLGEDRTKASVSVAMKPQIKVPGVISGRVVDADTGKGISSVHAAYHNHRRSFSATTDENGNFAIDQVPEGEGWLTVKKYGYEQNDYIYVKISRDGVVSQTADTIRLTYHSFGDLYNRQEINDADNVFLTVYGNTWQEVYAEILERQYDAIDQLIRYEDVSDRPLRVGLTDMTGDSVPELFFLCMRPESPGFADLQVFTFDSGRAKCLIAVPYAFSDAGNGYFYSVFMVPGNPHLFIEYSSDAGLITAEYREDGRPVHYCKARMIYSGEEHIAYSADGKETDAEAYAELIRQIGQNGRILLAASSAENAAAATLGQTLDLPEALATLRAEKEPGLQENPGLQDLASASGASAYESFVQANFGSGAALSRLYDIDRDGVQELIVTTYNNHGEAWFYTFVNGTVLPLTFPPALPDPYYSQFPNTVYALGDVYVPLQGTGLLVGGSFGMGESAWFHVEKQGQNMVPVRELRVILPGDFDLPGVTVTDNGEKADARALETAFSAYADEEGKLRAALNQAWSAQDLGEASRRLGEARYYEIYTAPTTGKPDLDFTASLTEWWKLYEDENDIYLFSEGYYPVEQLLPYGLNQPGIQVSGTWAVRDSSLGHDAVGQFILDENNWLDLKTRFEFAFPGHEIHVTGGPSVELLQLAVEQAGGQRREMFWPDQAENLYDECNGFWVASESKVTMVPAYSWMEFLHDQGTSGPCGFRPVVRISKNTWE